MVSNKTKQISQMVEANSKFTGATFCDTVLESSKDEKVLSQSRVNSVDKSQAKLIPSRIDYNFFNYCSTCELKYPKQILRCKDCNQKVRTSPRTRRRAGRRRSPASSPRPAGWAIARTCRSPRAQSMTQR